MRLSLQPPYFVHCTWLILTLLAIPTLGRSVGHRRWANPVREEAMHKLLQVFGIGHPGQRERHHHPPQYMLDLYRAIADTNGLTLTPNPYYANVIRSFPDRDVSHQMHFYFNVTNNIPSKEKILEAEFHLYKLKPRSKLVDKIQDIRSHLLEVRIYQVTSLNGSSSNKLLDIRRISVHSVGWEVFYVKNAVMDWIRDKSKNLGLSLTVQTISGGPVDPGIIRFAKRHHHHVNKQPILVLFTDDGRKKPASFYPKIDFHDYGFPELSYYGFQPSDPRTLGLKLNEKERLKTRDLNQTRVRRWSQFNEEDLLMDQASSGNAKHAGSCSRHELYVDFEQIGWSTWIISPKGYNAYYCKGKCSFPLGQNQWPTNHATVQSIVHELSLTAGVDTPCCVPNKLYSITLLYFDEHANVILKQYDDMVAASCGCH